MTAKLQTCFAVSSSFMFCWTSQCPSFSSQCLGLLRFFFLFLLCLSSMHSFPFFPHLSNGQSHCELGRTLPINQIFRYLQNRSRVQAWIIGEKSETLSWKYTKCRAKCGASGKWLKCNEEDPARCLFAKLWSCLSRFGSMSKRTCELRAAFWALTSPLSCCSRIWVNELRFFCGRVTSMTCSARYMNLVIDDAEATCGLFCFTFIVAGQLRTHVAKKMRFCRRSWSKRRHAGRLVSN